MLSRVLAATGAAALCLSLLAACGGDEDPAPTVRALARGLARGDLAGVAFAGGATRQRVEADYDRLTSGVVEAVGRPRVSGGKPRVDGDAATATLTWTWPLPTRAWTYTAPVRLALVDGHWRVRWTPEVVSPSLAEDGLRLDAARITPVRGDIVSTDGRALVTARPVVRYGIDRSRVPAASAADAARRLARLLDLDADAYAGRVASAGPRAFVEAVVYRRDEAPPVSAALGRIPGAVALEGTRDLGPSRTFALPLLGTVGDVTAEMVRRSPDRYRPGDTAGLSGLEARYDTRLRGVPGTEIDLVAPDGTVQRQLFQADPRDGEPLRITLDARLQRLAEDTLADVRPASALVVLRPSTGAVLAAANGPGNGGVNLATYGRSAPGSTFKIADALALVRHGAGPGTSVACPPEVTVDGKRFGNDSWYPASALGRIPLSLAVAQSCNTAMIGAREQISHDDLVGAAASLGFGVDHDLGFPAYFGQVPAPAGETEHAADLIGQGKVLASPLAMATVVASVQAGRTVVPTLVDGVRAEAADGVAPLTSSEVDRLRTILRSVVTGGTGRGLADVPGPPVIAKTGTAEFDRDGRRLTHTWMVAAQGDLAVAAWVDEGVTGSATAGPLVESVLRGARRAAG